MNPWISLEYQDSCPSNVIYKYSASLSNCAAAKILFEFLRPPVAILLLAASTSCKYGFENLSLRTKDRKIENQCTTPYDRVKHIYRDTVLLM